MDYNPLAGEQPCNEIAGMQLLETEISRALISVFSTGSNEFTPTNAYHDAFTAATKAVRQGADTAWHAANPLEIEEHWLVLLGYRIAYENNLSFGGLKAVRIRAAQQLKLSLKETQEWDIALLVDAYCNTKLRYEWRYNRLAFRQHSNNEPFYPDYIPESFDKIRPPGATVQ